MISSTLSTELHHSIQKVPLPDSSHLLHCSPSTLLFLLTPSLPSLILHFLGPSLVLPFTMVPLACLTQPGLHQKLFKVAFAIALGLHIFNLPLAALL